MDLFLKLGDELRDLFKDLFPLKEKAILEFKMGAILKTACLIGGEVAEEAKRL